MEDRVNGLDHLLDEVEGLLDELTVRYGLEPSSGLK
jgi:hypothetical protein